MPKIDPLRPSPEKIKEGLRGVFEAVKREEEGETDALGKFLDAQEKKLKAERAGQSANSMKGKNFDSNSDVDSESSSPVAKSAGDTLDLLVEKVSLIRKATEVYGDGIEFAVWRLIAENPDLSDDELWRRISEYWDGLDEESRKRSKELKIDRSLFDRGCRLPKRDFSGNR